MSLTTARCLNPRALNRRNTRGKEADCNMKKKTLIYPHYIQQQPNLNICTHTHTIYWTARSLILREEYIYEGTSFQEQSDEKNIWSNERKNQEAGENYITMNYIYCKKVSKVVPNTP
jgi:hypothetical protein